jgi:replicative DNA helicase
MTLQQLDQYGIGFQTKVISALLTDKKFLQTINDVLTDEYFSNTAHRWIVKEILKYFNKYNTTPTMEVLRTELKKIDNDVLQVSVKEQLREAYQASDDDLAYIEEEFSGFCKNQQLKRALLNSVDLLKAGDYDSIRNIIDNALKSGQDKTLGHEYNKFVTFFTVNLLQNSN